MSPTKVLLLGGHGRVSMQLTPMLLAKKWDVTSVVRNLDHEQEIAALGNGQPGKVEVLVESLDDVKSPDDAQKVLDKVKPDIVVWSAGAGGKGGPERTDAIDRDAAKYYISSSLASSFVKKFLMISYISSRHSRASWWSDDDWAAAQKVNHETLARYFQAKVDADHHFARLTAERAKNDSTFQGINLRPGILTDEEGDGKVLMGKTPARGKSSRTSVAAVAAELLDRSDTRGWYDMLDGDEPIKEAVDRLVREGFDSIDGEKIE